LGATRPRIDASYSLHLVFTCSGTKGADREPVSKLKVAHEGAVMSEQEVVAHQKTILGNQATILENQKTIQGHQGSILENQKTILTNQAKIEKNQSALQEILKNQKEILAAVKK
jgi:hypothetical protein